MNSLHLSIKHWENSLSISTIVGGETIRSLLGANTKENLPLLELNKFPCHMKYIGEVFFLEKEILSMDIFLNGGILILSILWLKSKCLIAVESIIKVRPST